MLIIEGADLVGKTTLAKALCAKLNELGWPHVYQHLSRLPAPWQRDAVRNYDRLCSPYSVRDRFHYSEPVYASARGDDPMISPGDFEVVNNIVRSVAGYVIIVTATEELIAERYARRAAQEMYDLHKILRVNEDFRHAAEVGRFAISQNGKAKDEYYFPVDLHVRCSSAAPFPCPEEIRLAAYTSRLMGQYHYPGARVVSQPRPMEPENAIEPLRSLAR